MSARVSVSPHGAHVTSWMTADGREQLYLSGRSEQREGVAIRGGVPIIFPQFSTFGPLPRHGFARTRVWEPIETGDDAHAAYRLHADDATRAIWPHRFEATYEVTATDDTLHLALTIANTGADAFTFSAALHTYLRVANVASVEIDGLQHVRYRDQTAAGVERAEAEPIRFAGEVDRIYVDPPSEVTLRDGDRTVVARMDGFRDVVVWNPGATLAATIGDLDDGGWRHFVCIEAAAIAAPITLAPGATWTGAQRIAVRRDPPRPSTHRTGAS